MSHAERLSLLEEQGRPLPGSPPAPPSLYLFSYDWRNLTLWPDMIVLNILLGVALSSLCGGVLRKSWGQ